MDGYSGDGGPATNAKPHSPEGGIDRQGSGLAHQPENAG